MPVPRREPDRPPPVAAGSSTLSAVYGSLSAVTTLEFFEHPLRRWVIGYLLMTQLYPLTRLLLTPRTRKRPPQHGFVQVRLWDICRCQSLRFLLSDGQSEAGCSPDSYRQTPRVYECYWAHFAAEIHLDE